MKKSNKIKISGTYQKNRKSISGMESHQNNSKLTNTETRSNSENGHILEQILSDMAWYG